MAASRRAGASFSSGADRWLVLAGAGLLVLGLVLRLLTDIGRSTATVDSLPSVTDTVAAAPARALEPTPAVASAPEAAAPAESTAAASLGARAERAEPAPAAIPKPRPASVGTPVPSPAPKTAERAPSVTGGWQVQLGVFGEAANAEKLKGRVESLGYAAEITPVGTRLRVRAVGLADEPAARAAADSIATALGVRGSLVAPR